ncbi:cation:proton antiporter, partial [Candidatus Woesearchaeota archaeon CG_4_10_14_0_8_um_filter_47_5]
MSSLLSNPGIEMSIYLFAVLLGCALSHKLRQSVLVGEILIGILIGPSILGLV